MRLEKFQIRNYRSISDISIRLPKNKPLILFGPNNAGKSNILSGLDRLLGEKYPTYIEAEDSDYFMRNRENYPKIEISAEFDEPYHVRDYISLNAVCLTYDDSKQFDNNMFHDYTGKKLFISKDDRAKLQSILLGSERSTAYQFNYSNKYSLLSKFNRSLHSSLTDSEKEDLKHSFEDIKETFQGKREFKTLFSIFKNSIEESVKGFVHHLEVDFSAYDPNNYANILRIAAYEGNNVRSFSEFGTGEQQILLMAFAKAYMEAFRGNNFLLILEEPETNLHPLAQKWLKKYIYDLCSSGLQVIISTHSPYFISFENLEGLVRVFKKNGVTNIKQVSEEELAELLIATGVPKEKIKESEIGQYLENRLYSEQLEGLFAEKLILVEGLTEKLSLPIWFERENFFLPNEGVEVVNCMGKSNIPLIYRIYKAFGYECIAIFDGDYNKKERERKNTLLEPIFKNCCNHPNAGYFIGENYVMCEYDFENSLKVEIENYTSLIDEAKEFGITNKQGLAKYMAKNASQVPKIIKDFISLAKCESVSDYSVNSEVDTLIPF